MASLCSGEATRRDAAFGCLASLGCSSTVARFRTCTPLSTCFLHLFSFFFLFLFAFSLALPASASLTPVSSSQAYVRDSLVAQWDGEDNAGVGVHDASATVWKNLGTEGSVWDLAPTNDTSYSWNDQSLAVSSTKSSDGGVQGAFAVAHADKNVKQIEFTGTMRRNGIVFGTHATSDTSWAFGNVNGVYWYRESMSDPYATVALNTFYVHSWDRANAKLYRNRIELAHRSASCGGLGLPENTTIVGAVWTGGNPLTFSVRLYKKTLSAAERYRNYVVDQVRFQGGNAVSLMSADDGADVPALVVAGDPADAGTSSPAYGVSFYDGTYSGTATLSGLQTYEDGSSALPDADDPTHLRSLFVGSTLRIGDGEPAYGEAMQVTIPETSVRVMLTWRLTFQGLFTLTAGEGGRIQCGSGAAVSATNVWLSTSDTLRAVPDEGWAFDYWSGDTDGIDDIHNAAPTFSSVQTRTLVAHFFQPTTVAATEGLSARSYVKRGLTALWDAAENAGYGVHNAVPTRWRQLVGGASHPDFTPDSGSTSAWTADKIQITKGAWRNTSAGAVATMEACMQHGSGLVLSLYSPADGTHRLLGYANSWYYLKNGGQGFAFCPDSSFHSYSADCPLHALCVDGVQKGYSGNCWFGGSGNQTIIGNYYNSPNPSFKSLRYYSVQLTDAERQLNYGIDRVRFLGATPEAAFANATNANVVVVTGDPGKYGTSTPAYGAYVYDGETNMTFTLSGTREYDDGVTAFPDVDDPDGSRRSFLGWSVRRGIEDAVLGSGTSATVSDITNRTFLTWRFGPEQVRLGVTASAGGAVAVGTGAAPYSLWYDADDATEVTLVATPAKGYAFSYWSGQTDGFSNVTSATVTATMDAAHQVVAHFTKIYDLSWTSYVQHGLAAQLDGEYNAVDAEGNPCHSSTATTWKQLITTSTAKDATLQNATSLEDGRVTWLAKGVSLDSKGFFRMPNISSDSTVTPKQTDGNGWFAAACKRVAAGTGGAGFESCILFPATNVSSARITLYLVRPNNQNVCKMDCFRAFTWGDEQAWGHLAHSQASSGYYYDTPATSDMERTYATHSSASTRKACLYRNGLLIATAGAAAINNYFTDQFLGAFNLGQSSRMTYYAFRVYTNELSRYEIAWNAAVDRARFFGRSQTVVAFTVNCPYGTSVPSAGTRNVYAETEQSVSVAASLADYDDGVRGVAVSDGVRGAFKGWTYTTGGPVPSVDDSGEEDTVTVGASNLVATLDWKFEKQYRVIATATRAEGVHRRGPGGTMRVGEVEAGIASTNWIAAGASVTVKAIPDPGWIVEEWSGHTAVEGVRRKQALAVTPTAATAITVTFVPRPPLCIIVK